MERCSSWVQAKKGAQVVLLRGQAPPVMDCFRQLGSMWLQEAFGKRDCWPLRWRAASVVVEAAADDSRECTTVENSRDGNLLFCPGRTHKLEVYHTKLLRQRRA